MNKFSTTGRPESAPPLADATDATSAIAPGSPSRGGVS